MKISFLFVLFLISIVSLKAENLYVIHVKGEIFNCVSQKNIKRGDVLYGEEQLIFSTSNDQAVVISKTRGRLVLKNKVKSKSEKEMEPVKTLSEMIFPPLLNHFQSIRGHEKVIVEKWKELNKIRRASWGQDIKIFPKLSLKEQLGQKKVLIKQTNISFFAEWESNRFVIPTTQFDDKSEVEVYAYNPKTGKAKLLFKFSIVKVDKGELIEELKLMSQLLKTETEEEKRKVRETLYQFVVETYAQCDFSALESLILEEGLL